jgi:hypothetical protein
VTGTADTKDFASLPNTLGTTALGYSPRPHKVATKKRPRRRSSALSILPPTPSGEQHEIRFGEQRTLIVDVGGGMRDGLVLPYA